MPRVSAATVALVLVGVLVAGCYGSIEATRDTNRHWRGRSRAQLESQWGAPHEARREQAGAVLRYSFSRSRVQLPSASGYLVTGPGRFEGQAVFRPGVIEHIRHDALVAVGNDGIVLEVRGPSLRWGPPDDVNMRWGGLFGAHAGMGALDDTSTPLPSGGLYIGGMLSPTLALVGTFSMAAGKDDAGGALAFAWGLAPQYWVHSRVWLRAGPAMILAFDPGFENVGLEPGATTGASYALIRSRSFVLDLRLDLSVGTSTVFGTAGIGVNIN